ncbi:TOM1 protein 2 [Phytophthora cinnamomi]|uniref:TOM1 protein 2 n=1 Tax=Phytophthora cinnamomi TaxID=4785 RepID=UPI0035593ACF|nr:TOM1 protein 2 [Phytophthora cinnamomi]
MATEAEELVLRATDEALAGPEWALNMALCDCANAQPAACADIVRLLQRRLQSGQPKVALLALVLTETLVKNGPAAVHALVGSRPFLGDVAALADGGLGVDVQDRALLLIRQWADAFKGGELLAFQDVYRQLKLQGVAFRRRRTTRPSSRRRRRLRRRPGTTLFELRGAAHQGADGEQLEDVLDFLRQCQPRMNTLIEGGIMGKIDEHTLEECLNVNDNLMKTLEECSKTKTNDMMTFSTRRRARTERPGCRAEWLR